MMQFSDYMLFVIYFGHKFSSKKISNEDCNRAESNTS